MTTTEREIERLIAVAGKNNRHGHRDSTMILLAFRHGLRASELCSLPYAAPRNVAPRNVAQRACQRACCCVRAASGNAVAPPSSVMNARRFIRLPKPKHHGLKYSRSGSVHRSESGRRSRFERLLGGKASPLRRNFGSRPADAHFCDRYHSNNAR